MLLGCGKITNHMVNISEYQTFGIIDDLIASNQKFMQDDVSYGMAI